MNFSGKPLILLFLLIVIAFTSCKKDDLNASKDDKAIREYLDKKGITAQKTASGLYYTIENAGSSVHPNLYSTVTVHYKGYLLDDSVFESSYGGTAPTFALYQVIQGWQEGLQLYGKGGSGTLYIPSRMAYGDLEKPSIPANSVLIFDIDLINVMNK